MLLALLISPPALADDLFVTRLKQSPTAVPGMMVGNLSGSQAALNYPLSTFLDNRYHSRRALYFSAEMSF